MTVPQVIEAQLEKNRAQELRELLIPMVEKIIQHVQDTDDEKLDIGPRFENPKDLYKILKLDNPELFATPLRGNSNEVVRVCQEILSQSVNTWHPGFMDKLYASTNPIGLLSDLLLSALNTNSHVFTVSPALSAIERMVSKKYANLFGFTGSRAGGLTFSGGSWSNITSLHMARSILHPETKKKGNYKQFAVFTSSHSHYSIEKACILLGMGSEALVKIPVDAQGCMLTDKLEAAILKSIEDGLTPLYINGTAGTTVFGSFDPFTEISKIAKKYNLWFHIDGSMGGNVIFSERKRKALEGSHLADSITTNPHKMLGVPTTCSFLLVPNDAAFQTANSLNAPYLFHNSRDDDTENFDLADGTMGCGRRADSLKFYLGWLYYGTEGYAERIDHAYSITEYFTKRISTIPGFHLVSDINPPCIQVCFYYNPKFISTAFEEVAGSENTRMTRYIATKLHSTGQFLVDYAPNPDDAIKGIDRGEFFRVVFTSPIITSEIVDKLIKTITQISKDLN